jgi:general secretion pathway protein G
VTALRKTVFSLLVVAGLVLGNITVREGLHYQKTILKARESVLREDLTRLRAAVTEYTLKQELPPQSLDDLVKAGYLREIPDDPITGKKDWKTTEAEIERGTKKAKGIVDIHSSAVINSSNGTPYNLW